MGEWIDSGDVDVTAFRAFMQGLTPAVSLNPRRAEGFRARVRYARAEEVTVLDLAGDPFDVVRGELETRRRPGDIAKIILMLEGHGTITQDGRTAELGPGDFAVEDSARPYEANFPDRTHQRVIMFPHHYIDLPVSQVAQVTAVRFSPDEGLGNVLNPFLAELGSSMVHLDGPHAKRFVHSAVDLLVTVLSDQLRQARGSRTRQQADVIRAWVEDNLADPDLGPALVADAHHMSVRNVHAVFAGEEHTLAAWIRLRRLERIRRDLEDPIFVDEPISTVAARYGMTNAAHLSRLFKAEFGMAPSQCRRAAQRSA